MIDIDKDLAFAIAQGKHIANTMKLIQDSVHRACLRQDRAPIDAVCSDCGDDAPCTFRDHIALCETCHQEEVQ